MATTCPSCGHENPRGRIACQQCGASLLQSVRGISDREQADIALAKRRVFSLLAAGLTPWVLLGIYVGALGRPALEDVTTLWVIIAGAAVIGVVFLATFPAKLWVRGVLIALYMPFFLFGLFVFVAYAACALGMGCL